MHLGSIQRLEGKWGDLRAHPVWLCENCCAWSVCTAGCSLFLSEHLAPFLPRWGQMCHCLQGVQTLTWQFSLWPDQSFVSVCVHLSCEQGKWVLKRNLKPLELKKASPPLNTPKKSPATRILSRKGCFNRLNLCCPPPPRKKLL